MSESRVGTSAERPLTFQWQVKKLTDRGRLFVFLLASLFIHAGFFYFVRVASNEPARSLPETGEILLLHHANPNAAALLQRIDDRAELTTGSLRWSVSNTYEPEGATYRPTYFEHDLLLERVPKSPSASAGNEVFPPAFAGSVPGLPPVRGTVSRGRESGGGTVLPPVDTPGTGSAAAEDPVQLPTEPPAISIDLGGSLGSRQVVRNPEVDPSEWAAAETGRVVFFLGVERSGRVSHTMLVSDSAAPTGIEKIKAFVSLLVFDPAEDGSSDIVWGPVEIRW